jgi:shikimate kinase
VRRILLTGMSGTGKSAVVAELAARGHLAVDLDCDEYSEWIDAVEDDRTPGTPVEHGRDWVWREDRVRELLETEQATVLFVSGCAANMGGFLDRFDEVVLLHVPEAVIADRLRARPAGAYGAGPGELERVVALTRTVEPVLRHVATCEIDTGAPLDDVVAAVVRLTRDSG